MSKMIQAHVKAFLAILLVAQVHGIMFFLEPNSHKCLKEEVHANVLVTGEYEVSEAMGQKANYVVSRLTIFHSFFTEIFLQERET